MTYDPNIKAIPTEFKGTKFRSRLEARWAFFFEQMGIRWEYEPSVPTLEDGMDGIKYQPDFLVNAGKAEWPELTFGEPTFVEVKPGSFTFTDFASLETALRALCYTTRRSVFLVVGDVDNCSVMQWGFYTREDGISLIEMSFGNQPAVYTRRELPDGGIIDFRAAECATAAAKHRFPVR